MQQPSRPRTTRIAGQLPLDEVGMPLPAPPAPQPSRLEVTQPYIPAIRDQAPEFVKRLNPGSPTAARPVPAAPPPPPPWASEQTLQQQPVPAAPPRPNTAPPAAQPKRRSLARRVIRRIIGPDLLRKDPPKPPRRTSD
jgi:hypothetical protein